MRDVLAVPWKSRTVERLRPPSIHWLVRRNSNLARLGSDFTASTVPNTTIVEGGFVMANAMEDGAWLQRQSAEYRRYLELLFRPRPQDGMMGP